MELWECVNYKQFADNKPFCEKGKNLKDCSGDCPLKYTYGEYREMIKDIPVPRIRRGNNGRKDN